jgi:hypothetical protein
MTIDRFVAHANRVWFKGVLTFVDRPSDHTVQGTKVNPKDDKETNRRVLIPADVAESALDSLIGMPIYYHPRFDQHTYDHQCGIVTEAVVAHGRIIVRGFLYGRDHPELIRRLNNASKTGEVFGFSYDALYAHIRDMTAKDVWVTSQLTFRGATLVLAKHAAYKQTRIYLEGN